MKSTRCFNCRKKLGLMEFKCKCELKFCSGCVQPEKHKCTFDHKTRELGILKDKLIKTETPKVIKI